MNDYFCIRDNGDFKSGFFYKKDILYEEHKSFLIPVSDSGRNCYSCKFICVEDFGRIGDKPIDGTNDNRHLYPIHKGEIFLLEVFSDLSFDTCLEDKVERGGCYSQFDKYYHHFAPYYIYLAELRDKQIDEILTFS